MESHDNPYSIHSTISWFFRVSDTGHVLMLLSLKFAKNLDFRPMEISWDFLMEPYEFHDGILWIWLEFPPEPSQSYDRTLRFPIQ